MTVSTLCLLRPGTVNLNIDLLTGSGKCVINILCSADGRATFMSLAY